MLTLPAPSAPGKAGTPGPQPVRPGPQAANQIAPTFGEQLARALAPRPRPCRYARDLDALRRRLRFLEQCLFGGPSAG